MSMITATAWVPRGYAAQFPTKYTVDDEELARISKLAKLQLEDAKEDFKTAQHGGQESDADGDDTMDEDEGVKVPQAAADEDDDLRQYDLDHYDDDDVQGTITLSTLGNAKALAFHESNADDPNLTGQDEEDEDEREELQILGTDNMILAARVEDEVAHLEAYVYEDEADNLYVHHDIMLPAIPLSVAWLDIPVGKTQAGTPVNQNVKGNYVAVGTFEPDIELWDLDTVDCMYPNAILGNGGQEEAEVQEGQKKKKRKKSKKANDHYHVDAVLSLAANRNHRTLLASSSADKTIKLWDLKTLKCAKSYSHHTDKVCSIEWSPRDTTVLLSGSYDRTVVVADMRAPDATVPRWGVESDVESVRWNPHDPNYFFVTTENGMLHYHDVRQAPPSPAASKPLWQLQAHDESVSSLDINPTVPGYLATGSSNKEVKLWNVQASGPSMVVSRNLGVGKVFSTTFGPDPEVAFRLAVAGSKGAVQIWDTSTNGAVRRAFASRVKGSNEPVKERLVGLKLDSEAEESDSEEGEEGTEDKDGWESMEED